MYTECHEPLSLEWCTCFYSCLSPAPWPNHKHVVVGEVPVDDLEGVKVGKGP